MNETKNEQTEALAQNAEIAADGGESVSLGKFKDVNALLAAYNSLQAEFTKRCQRIKELEARVAVDKDTPTDKTAEISRAEQTERTAKTENSDGAEKADAENRISGITEEEKENFIKGYLKEIMGAKSKAIVMDGLGASVKTPVNRPRTVEEAGRLAKELLAKK